MTTCRVLYLSDSPGRTQICWESPPTERTTMWLETRMESLCDFWEIPIFCVFCACVRESVCVCTCACVWETVCVLLVCLSLSMVCDFWKILAHTMWWCCSVFYCVAVCCNVLQCVVVCCSVVWCVAVCDFIFHYVMVLQCVVLCCSVLQSVAVCCSVLHCVALCCSERF